jgi:hypothetical protein
MLKPSSQAGRLSRRLVPIAVAIAALTGTVIPAIAGTASASAVVAISPCRNPNPILVPPWCAHLPVTL